MNGLEANAPSCVGAGELAGEAIRKHAHLCLCLLQRDGRLQSRGDDEHATWRRHGCLRPPAGGPELRRAVEELELLWHHADDGRLLSVEPNHTTDHSGIGAEALLPQAMTQHQLARGGCWIVGFGEPAAECRFGAEHREQRRMNALADDRFAAGHIVGFHGDASLDN